MQIPLYFSAPPTYTRYMSKDYFDQSNELITDILKQTISDISGEWDSVDIFVNFGANDNLESRVLSIKNGVQNELQPPMDLKNMLLKLKDLNSSTEKGKLKGLSFHADFNGKFGVKYRY